MQIAIAERSIEPTETLYVGDGPKDMNAVLGAGFAYLEVESGLVTAEEFQQLSAVSVASIAEVFQQ